VEIIPFKSVGKLSFGDSRQVARQKLSSTFKTFRKAAGQPDETDSFDQLGLHLYYDNDGNLEFVEAFEPAEVTFRGIRFLGRERATVKKEMKEIGFSPAEDDYGMMFSEAGIAVTAPSAVVEGVAAHRKGYYD
jgi:hypothetical protein